MPALEAQWEEHRVEPPRHRVLHRELRQVRQPLGHQPRRHAQLLERPEPPHPRARCSRSDLKR